MKIFKRILIVLSILLVAALIYIGGMLYWFSIGAVDFEAIKFNSEKWKASEPAMSWESPRLKMIEDLIENHLSVNMQVSEVLSLIGKPDDTPYFRSYDMVYYLGRERNAIGIDSEWLVFKTKNNIVQSYTLVRD